MILTWSEYLDPNLRQNFETHFNVRIREVDVRGDALRNDMLLETSGAGYDLVMVSGVTGHAYRKHGWLGPREEDKIPNLRHIDGRWRNAFRGTSETAVPDFWGTAGVAYRRDRVKAPITRWMDLFRPEEWLRSKIGMVDSNRDVTRDLVLYPHR